jgi:hypothetical protein
MTWGAGEYVYDYATGQMIWRPKVEWPKRRQQQRTRKQVQRKQQKTRKQVQRKQQTRKQIKL